MPSYPLAMVVFAGWLCLPGGYSGSVPPYLMGSVSYSRVFGLSSAGLATQSPYYCSSLLNDEKPHRRI